MIIAGIDEAGYGPLLGPLVVGCCAFEVPDQTPSDGQLPCIWTLLGKIVSRKRSKSGRKLHINDSKLVYSPADGLRELERSVLASAWAMCQHQQRQDADMGISQGAATTDPLKDLESLLACVAGHVLGDLPRYVWYRRGEEERFPLEQERAVIHMFANALRVEMARTSGHCLHLSARVLLEGELNHLLNQTRNKSNVLFSTAAIHLDHLLRNYGHRGLVIFCDRQGGRAHYGALLRMMFDQWALSIVNETEGDSEYRLERGGHAVRLIFREKAEAQCLPVALASMLCKYLREALMRRFNAYWQSMLPQVTPTAGYYTDGQRFLADIDAKRRELGISDQELIRCR